MNADTGFAQIRRALISVSDKSGIIEFARALGELGIEIISTGGTFGQLKDAGIPVIEISSYTGFPEIMQGRVKTLHPKVHGGILARRGQDEAVMQEHDIHAIDLVVVNLYPFAATIARPECDFDMAIENIDIGGPTMIRAAAKNMAHVGVVTSPEDYPAILDELKAQRGGLTGIFRKRLATRAFAHTAAYDSMISGYLDQQINPEQVFSPELKTHASIAQELRYGENPHQRAAFYRAPDARPGCIATAEQHQGKELSFNNIADTDAALECVKVFSDPACVIVKHANPCGVAESDSLAIAYEHAYQTDPTSAFGGIIAFNRIVDGDLARTIVDRQFVEVLVAPGFTDSAIKVAAEKKNLRLLSVGELGSTEAADFDLRSVGGGFLLQDADSDTLGRDDLEVVSARTPSDSEFGDLLFAWRVARFVKSNAIVYASGQRTLGVGAGQMSRVDSAKIAIIKAENAGLSVSGSVMASDAFFPFRDGIDAAAEAGVRAVIQPGGSMRDAEVIAAADEADIAMVFTGRRHFRH